MRKKVDSVDYHYFTEPNIVNIDIKYLLPEAKKSMTDLPNRIKEQLTQSNVNINIINQLLDDFDSYLIFKHVNELVNDVKLTTT
jgi:Asp-tRNA(Asn)/Glu-tRNA(Gln) amidotransferase B subunit